MTKTCEEQLVAALAAKDLTLSTAESCTGGGIGARITAVAGASAVYLGGVISYANEIKTALLGVCEETLLAAGAVSAEVAEQMARGARARLCTDYALSVTGLAGPGGATPQKPVGLVYLGLARPDGTVATRRCFFSGDRDEIRNQSATAALEWLLQEL